MSPPPSLPVSRTERRRAARETLDKQRELRGAAAESDLREVVRRDGVLALGCEVGLAALDQMMDEDATQQCGVQGKGKHSPTRTGRRNGREAGSVILGSRRFPILRPRVVDLNGKELPIESYNAARDPRFLDQAVLAACVGHVTQRKHRTVVETLAPLGGSAQDATGLSKSAVGRRFIAAADGKLEEVLQRRLDDRFLAVWIDAIQEADYAVVCAVGLTERGQKKVLGLRQGSTENTVLCREFLETLVGRGFSAESGVLFVVDGGKGLSRALREVFGNHVLVQRCRIHKKRNVLDKLTLTGDERAAFIREFDALWRYPGARVALAHLELLARSLEAQGQKAAAGSLREGAKEMFTCTRLGIPDELHVSLSNTNAIESTFSQHEDLAVRVKRWRNGQQVLRWVAMGVLEAEKAYSTVGTGPLMQRLGSVLEAALKTSSSLDKPTASPLPSQLRFDTEVPPALAA
jgi:transposase-like protein